MSLSGAELCQVCCFSQHSAQRTFCPAAELWLSQWNCCHTAAAASLALLNAARGHLRCCLTFPFLLLCLPNFVLCSVCSSLSVSYFHLFMHCLLITFPGFCSASQNAVIVRDFLSSEHTDHTDAFQGTQRAEPGAVPGRGAERTPWGGGWLLQVCPPGLLGCPSCRPPRSSVSVRSLYVTQLLKLSVLSWVLLKRRPGRLGGAGGVLPIASLLMGITEAVRGYLVLKFTGSIGIQATFEVSVRNSSALRFLKPESFPSLGEVGRRY